LASHGFPWTLYLTTYYAEKQTPIVNVAIHYLVWKSTRLHISLAAFNSEIDSNVYLRTNREKHAFAESMLKKAAKLNTAEARHDFLRNLAIALEVDLSEIEKTRILHIMTLDTARDLYQKGGDIQLHTHRHILVHGNKEQILLEIEDNRRRVSAIGNLNAVHFCYPSGEYAIQDYVHLAECGIKSATTCNPGLNFKSANLLALCRFLDGENISQIEFEAELSGFSHFIRPHRKSLSSSKAMGDKL
jgi:peptidoglycan/xylan/chitin deacetylase (PgdA/CDA1 family)